jgi:eukaryotic-like serine/threonine-protein kinase
MEAEPKASTDSEAIPPAQLPPTEGIAGDLLKGRYLLGPELGRGGFAITYLATDLEVASRKVVVKVLNEWRSNNAWALKKFRSEMEALARIDHPNVVSIIDFGQRENGKPFLVMQYVSGHSLRHSIPRSGLPLLQVVQIIRQIGRALSAAHEAGVCHRDLKPENIMVQTGTDGEEQIKLIDFGIATVEQMDSNSQSSSTVGTYVYMAPEQFKGKSSVASDIYQMGVLAYELVTGIVPFRAPSLGDLMQQKMEGLKVLPQDLRPDLPEAAQEIILKALALNPTERYQKAKDFGDALAAALVSGDWETLPLDLPEVRRSSTTYRRARQSRKRRRLQWAMAGVLMVLVAVAVVIYFFSAQKSHNVSDSVAVLPFENQTGDPQFAYLTEGITESLINDLSHIPTVRVSARGSVLPYEKQMTDARTAGRALGVSRIVTGSVSRQADTFSFYVELIDVDSGMRLWGNKYSGRMAALTTTLQQFSTEVTDQLRLKLSKPLKERIARQFAVGSVPYQNYLKGRFYLNQRTSAGFREAIHYFTQAIASDPNYAPAYSGLANTYSVMAGFGSAYVGQIPAEALQQARTAADHALELDSTLAEAYAARGVAEMQGDYDWIAAEQDFQRAIQLNPNWPDAHEFYAFDLGALGRFENAIEEINTAERLEPNSVGIVLARSMILHMASREDESFAVVRRLTGNPIGKELVIDQVAEYYWAKERPREALAAVQAVSPAVVAPEMRVPLLVAAYAYVGQSEKAREVLTSYVVRPESAWWYYLVLAHLALHDTNEALTSLEHAYEQRYGEVIWIGVDPLLNPLRSHPRFRALLDRVQQTKTKG